MDITQALCLFAACFVIVECNERVVRRANCPRITDFPGRVKYKRRGTKAQFKCPKGYKRYGNRYIVCQSNNKWNGVPPLCIKSGCSLIDLTGLDNLDMSEKYKGALVQFSCEGGYVMIGESETYCDGRNWSAAPPTCATTRELTECDFEQDICGWTQDTTDDLDWTRHVGGTATGHTGPSSDHTYPDTETGHYLYVEASSPAETGDQARLLSPIYPHDLSPMCFEFWYHMMGPDDTGHVGTLEVFVRKDSQFLDDIQPLFYKEGNQGPEWLSGQVDVDSQSEPYQIIIVVTRKMSYISDIAIDDIRLYNCSEGETTTTTTETPAPTTTTKTTPVPLTTTPTPAPITTPSTTSTSTLTSSTASLTKPILGSTTIAKTSTISSTSTPTQTVNPAASSASMTPTLTTSSNNSTTTTFTSKVPLTTTTARTRSKSTAIASSTTSLPSTSSTSISSPNTSAGGMPPVTSSKSAVSTSTVTVSTSVAVTTVSSTTIGKSTTTVSSGSTTAAAAAQSSSTISSTKRITNKPTTKQAIVDRTNSTNTPTSAAASTTSTSTSTTSTPLPRRTASSTASRSTSHTPRSTTSTIPSTTPTLTLSTGARKSDKTSANQRSTQTGASSKPTTRSTIPTVTTSIKTDSPMLSTKTKIAPKTTSSPTTLIESKTSIYKSTTGDTSTKMKSTTTKKVKTTKSVINNASTVPTNTTGSTIMPSSARSHHPADHTLRPVMIGAGVGIVVGLIIIAVVVWVCVRKRKYYTRGFEDELKPITNATSAQSLTNVDYYQDDDFRIDS